VPEGFGRAPSTVKHFSSSVSQAYDKLDNSSATVTGAPSAPLPPRHRSNSDASSGSGSGSGRVRGQKSYASSVSRAYDDAGQPSPPVVRLLVCLHNTPR
jgi:hypothetical protein